MTATVLALHRSIAVARLPLAKRAELLAWLARAALDMPPEAVTILRDSWSHDSLYGPELEARFRDYLERAAITDAADQGVFDWRVSCPELSCSDRTEVASEVARKDAEDALTVLVGGITNGGFTS